MMSKTIQIATEFTKFPGPRYKINGDFSGEVFREEVLRIALSDAIKNNVTLTVVLDDVAGYGSSFLEEAFGGLLRHGFTKEQLDNHLKIDARTPRFRHHAVRAIQYIEDEDSRQRENLH